MRESKKKTTEGTESTDLPSRMREASFGGGFEARESCEYDLPRGRRGEHKQQTWSDVMKGKLKSEDWQVGVLRRAVKRVREARELVAGGDSELAAIRLEGLEVDLMRDMRELESFLENKEHIGGTPSDDAGGCEGCGYDPCACDEAKFNPERIV